MAHVKEVERKGGKAAYEVRWRDNGRFKQRTFSVRRDAERFALRIEDELHSGNTTEVYVRRGKTVADMVEASSAASAARLRPRTVTSYGNAYTCHVLPALGHRRVSTVTSEDVERWIADLSAKGLAPATIRNTYVALNKVFRYALRHNHVSRNPCAGTPLPTAGQKFEPRFLTPDEVEAVAAQLDGFPPYGLLVRFAAYTGLRAAETAGLQVRDLDLMRRRVTVRRTMQRIKGGWLVGAPKSDKSRRTVPLRADLVAALADHMGQHPTPHEQRSATLARTSTGDPPTGLHASFRSPELLPLLLQARRCTGGPCAIALPRLAAHVRVDHGGFGSERLQGVALDGPRERQHHHDHLHTPLRGGLRRRHGACRRLRGGWARRRRRLRSSAFFVAYCSSLSTPSR